MKRRHRMLAIGGFSPFSANPEARDPPAVRRHLIRPLAGAVRRKAQPESAPRQRQRGFRQLVRLVSSDRRTALRGGEERQWHQPGRTFSNDWVGPAGPVFTPLR